MVVRQDLRTSHPDPNFTRQPLNAYEKAHLYGTMAACGEGDHAHRSLFRNRWMHDKQNSNEEVSAFHKGMQTMVAFKGIKSAEDWLMTDRHIVFGKPMDQDERFTGNAEHAAVVPAACPDHRHSYTGHSLGVFVKTPHLRRFFRLCLHTRI